MSISGGPGDNFVIAEAATAPVPLTARIDAVPPHAYFVGSAIFHYLGPSFAVLLFARVDVLGVAWLRIASAALVFAVWRRPWRKFVALDRQGRLLIVSLGAVFAVMNACFYISIDRLPLATVAAIEFIGPIALAVIGAHTSRNFAAVLAAVAGVYLLTHVRFGGQPVGVAFAFAIAAGIGVGVSSSVIPYVCDQLAMARLARATYALFVALLPATATVIGVVVLQQLPTTVDLAGIALVMAGVALHREAF